MKIVKTICVVLVLALFACSSPTARNDADKVLYKSVYKEDTAKLNIRLNDRTFDGQFEIKYHGAVKDSGDVNGIVKGDTLKGTYHFQHYGIEEWHRIPIALLKKEGKLIMGVGEMEIYMNMTFFSKSTPIDYQNVKFIFDKSE